MILASKSKVRKEILDMNKFKNLGIIKNSPDFNNEKLNYFESSINNFKSRQSWTKPQILEQFFNLIPEFSYKDLGRYLDGKM